MSATEDILGKLGDTKETLKSSETLNSSDRQAVLELTLEEMRIIYGRLDLSNDTLKVRILTFLGAGLALLSYLYGGGNLFIPQEQYGRVLYFIGLGLVISSISILLNCIRPSWWSVPIETRLTKILRHKNKLELLETLVEEYVESMSSNIIGYERKTKHMHSAFFQLLCGGILLLVIKSIGG